MRATAASALLGGVAVAALVTEQLWALGVLVAVLLAACLRAGRRARPYLWGALVSAGFVFLLWPLLQTTGYHVLWSGPTVPVLGPLDLTTEELLHAGIVALQLAAVGLAFAAWALLVDHDRLLAAATGRRSVLAAALAVRLVPTLQRDANGLVEALRGRGGGRDALGRSAGRRGVGAAGPARPCRAPLTAARRLARARAESRGGDGGARL